MLPLVSVMPVMRIGVEAEVQPPPPPPPPAPTPATTVNPEAVAAAGTLIVNAVELVIVST